MRLIKTHTLLTLTLLLMLSICSFGLVHAAEGVNPHEYPERMLSRGEAVDRIVKTFELKKNYSSFISKCLINADDCFFVFAAMSDFEGISFNPLTLYPDVNPKNRYYDSINVASMLSLVHGYLEQDTTPFKPEIVISRIQALKVVIGAAELMKWKEKFELNEAQISLFDDIAADDDEKWWYPRYANFAKEIGIVPDEGAFRPDEPIKLQELKDMMDKTLEYKQTMSHDSKAIS